jgi:hypothetical protein
MVSAQTARDVKATIAVWADTNGIGPDAVETLLRLLSQIDGNKSFRDTTAALLRLWREASEAKQLADDLELLAEERAELGDAREAAVLRERARLVRAGEQDPG